MSPANVASIAKRGMRLASDTALVSLGRYSQYFVTILVIPITARTLGVDGVAELAVGTAATFFGSVAVDMGLTQVLAVRAAAEELPWAKSAYALLRAGVLAAFALVLCVIYLTAPNIWLELVALGLLAGAASSVGEDWLLIAHLRYGQLALAQLIGRIGYLGALYVLLPSFPSPVLAIWALAGSNFLYGGFTWVFARGLASFSRPPRNQIGWLLRQSAALVPSRLLSLLTSQLPIFVYSGTVVTATVGLFASSDKVARAGQAALDAFSLALLPRLARSHSRDVGRFWRDANRASAAAFGFGLIASAVACVLTPWVVRLLYGSQFLGAIAALRVEVWIIGPGAVTSVVMSSVLYVKRDSIGIFWLSIAGLLTVAASVTIIVWAAPHQVWMAVGAVAVDSLTMIYALARARQLQMRETAEPTNEIKELS